MILRLCLGHSPTLNFLKHNSNETWRVTLADTGLSTMTGGRLKRIEKYVDTELFMLTYGDAVSDVDLEALYRYHLSHGKIGTVTGVRPPSRFGELETNGTQVTCFAEKPTRGGLINGGFFVFNRKIFDYVTDSEQCSLEQEPLAKLASDGELIVRRHEGFWQCMDTLRDVMYLRGLVEKGELPWLKLRKIAV